MADLLVVQLVRAAAARKRPVYSRRFIAEELIGTGIKI
jgi:hypothetical protein